MLGAMRSTFFEGPLAETTAFGIVMYKYVAIAALASVALCGCSTHERTISLDGGAFDAAADGSPLSDASPNDQGMDAIAPAARAASFAMSANISYDSDTPFGTTQAVTLFISNVTSTSTPSVIGSSGTTAMIVLNASPTNGMSFTAPTPADLLLAPPTAVGSCAADPLLHYTDFSFTLADANHDGVFEITGSGHGHVMQIVGDTGYTANFTATFRGMEERVAPAFSSIVTTGTELHPMDPMALYFSEPLDSASMINLVGMDADAGTNIRLLPSDGSDGAFMSAQLSTYGALPWGMTSHLQISDGVDLTNIPFNTASLPTSAYTTPADPGLFTGFDADTPALYLASGARVALASEFGLTTSTLHVVYVPTGAFPEGDAAFPTGVTGRVTLRVPFQSTDNVVHVSMALVLGAVQVTGSFTGHLEAALPNSERRIYFDSVNFAHPIFTNSVSGIASFSAPIGSRSHSETDLWLDLRANVPSCSFGAGAARGVVITDVHTATE